MYLYAIRYGDTAMKEFSTLGIACTRQLSAWQEIMSEVYYSVEVKRESREGLRGQIDEFEIGPLSITTFDSDEQRVFRTRERIAVDPEDSFVLVMPARQHLFFSHNGRSGLIPPGGYVLVSTSEFYELSCPDDFLNWTVKIPGAELRNRVPNVEDHCGCRFPNNPEMARMAQGLFSNVAQTFSARPPPNPTALAGNLMDFVALVVQSEQTDGKATARRTRYQLKRRIITYVRERLTDPDLSPATVAAANGISVSYLYRLFAENGVTVAQFIKAQRLQRAYELLASDRNGQLTVAEVAYTVGFRNVSHFSRVFSQKFQLAPRDVRHLCL